MSNPLVAFRNSKELIARTGQTHAATQRDDVVNDTGLCNFYPGDFTYLLDETLEIELASCEDADIPQLLAVQLQMTGVKGYEVAMAEEWQVSYRLQNIWKKDEAGRLTLGGRSKNALVLMFRTGEAYDRDQKRRLRVSDEIAKSVEEKRDEMRDKLGQIGQVRMALEDDHSTRRE